MPVAVNTDSGLSALFGKTVVAMSAGLNHSMALCSDGTMTAWGDNFYGQLGDSTTTSRQAPVAVNIVNGLSALYGRAVVRLVAGQNHNVVQFTDGTLAAWGSNSYGELGDTTTTQRNVPVLVNTASLVAGQQFSTLPRSCSNAFELTMAVVAAPAYPTVTTQASVAVSGTSATLNGTVAAANTSMAVSFDYGTTASYGTNVAATPSPISSGTPTPVSATLTGLQPGTTYHYRVNGVNSAGTLNGNDLTFSTLNNNADLASLVPSTGTLTPAFASGTLNYTTSVPYLTTSITVTPTLADTNAQVQVNGVTVSSGSTSSSISLIEGNNTVSITVTAQDGITLQTYTLTVVRAAGPTLSGLGLSSGTLSPTFASATTSYTATLPSASNTLTLTPSSADSNATVTINGQSVALGSASSPISINYGSNPTITLVITAPDGVSTRTYTVVVSRTLTASYSTGSDVPLTSNGFTATGGTVSFALNYAPAPGTNLTVLNNTGQGFIGGVFSNLAQGQAVPLNYNGITYNFVANYYGGSGNDLVLMWANSRALSWGSNSNGQLGDTTSTQRTLPVPVFATGVLAGKVIVAIAVGGSHTLALCSDGTLAAWGSNIYGQLGDNTTNQRTTPVAVNTASGVSSLFGKKVIAISAGFVHSLALCSDGTVSSWGNGVQSQLGNGLSASRVPQPVNTAAGSALNGKTVVAVAAGLGHNLALCSDGTVATWGYNPSGQLGINSATNRSVPTAVNTTSGVSSLFGKTVLAVAAGSSHSLALCSDGTLAAWGLNSSGQVGDNSSTSRLVPVAVNTVSGTSALAGKTVASLAGGGTHSLVLCTDGSLAAWGSNASGQVGDNSTTNRLVPTAVNTASGISALYGKTVTAVVAGSSHSLAQTADGTLAGWGLNSSGQVGDNTTSNDLVPVTVIRSPLTSDEVFTGVYSSPSAAHSLALAAGPPAPQASSLAAGSITANSAILNGSVIANSNSTSVTFDYGTTAAYGTNVTATPATVTSLSATAVSLVLTGLTPGTTYHFRVNAVNAVGSNSSIDQTFTTLSTNADLANLTLGSGTLNPSFASATTSYTASVPSNTSTLTLIPTVAESHAVLTVNSFGPIPSSSSVYIPLNFGDNAISTVVTAQDGSTTKTYVVTVTRLTSVQSWRQTWFGTTASTGTTADAADFDNDGIPNLIEWACLLDPTKRSTLPLSTVSNGANFEYTYSRSTAAATAGTAFTVEWSDSLTAGSWSSNGVTQTVLSDDGTTQQVKAVIPISGANSRFVHLSVTAPP